jgi:RNA polymerase-binding transcription factor DksA
MASNKNKVNSGAGKAREMGKKMGQMIIFPLKVLQPLIKFLKHEEKRLKKAEKSLEKEDPFSDSSRVDDNAIDTDVVEQVEHERVSATKAAINRSLVSVRKTMTRVKLGRYGICEECHKMIDTDRLAINLTTEYCVKCASKVEKKKKK